jgi:hypothetical protein
MKEFTLFMPMIIVLGICALSFGVLVDPRPPTDIRWRWVALMGMAILMTIGTFSGIRHSGVLYEGAQDLQRKLERELEESGKLREEIHRLRHEKGSWGKEDAE